jgi:TatD DNase family protein
MDTRYIDAHSHLNDVRFTDDLLDVLARMRESRIKSIVVGTDESMSARAILLAKEHPDLLFASIGVHPTDNEGEVFDDARYRAFAKEERVVAIGECGLDYHWPAHGGWTKGESAEKERQRTLFAAQVRIAKDIKKPLMIHGRPTKGSMDAYLDILDVLHEYEGVAGNVHFFVGDIDVAKRFLDIGFTMSFTGVLTFASDYDDVVRYLPLERILSETDAPYVAPKAMRGKRNEPVFVEETVRRIAALRGEDESAVAEALVTNAERVFSLK